MSFFIGDNRNSQFFKKFDFEMPRNANMFRGSLGFRSPVLTYIQMKLKNVVWPPLCNHSCNLARSVLKSLKFPHLKCHPMEICVVKCYLDKQSKYSIAKQHTWRWTLVYCISFHPFVLFTTVTTNHAVVIGIHLLFLSCFLCFFFFINIIILSISNA